MCQNVPHLGPFSDFRHNHYSKSAPVYQFVPDWPFLNLSVSQRPCPAKPHPLLSPKVTRSAKWQKVAIFY